MSEKRMRELAAHQGGPREKHRLRRAGRKSAGPVCSLRELTSVYRRMFQIPTEALSPGKLNERSCMNVRGGGTLATGSQQKIEELFARLENLVKSEMRPAQELRQEAKRLSTDLKSLHQNLSLAIAEKRLRRGCAMVPFL